MNISTVQKVQAAAPEGAAASAPKAAPAPAPAPQLASVNVQNLGVSTDAVPLPNSTRTILVVSSKSSGQVLQRIPAGYAKQISEVQLGSRLRQKA